MKSFVLNLSNKLRLPSVRKPEVSFKQLLKQHGTQIAFVLLFFLGLFCGGFYSVRLDPTILKRLDFLFLTNIASRVSMTAFEIFVACFSSNFLFLFTLFLFGLSAWGAVATPLLLLFKGFSVGLSSVMLFSLYSVTGLGFYLLVVLPGTLLFLFSLLRFAAESMTLSKSYFRLTAFGTTAEPYLSKKLKQFLFFSCSSLLLSAAAALVDMILWVLFAHLFHFG